MIIKDDWNETYMPNKNESVREMTTRYCRDLEDRGLLLKKNTTKVTRLKLPKRLDDIKDVDERLELQKSLLRQWKYGTKLMTPAMFAYFNLFRIHNRSRGGFIAPQFRNYDLHEFDLWHSAVHDNGRFYSDIKGKDILTLGARGKGKSAKIGINSITEAAFAENMNQFLFSKDESSIKDFLREKVALPYSTLPDYLSFKHHSVLMQFGLGKDVEKRSYIVGKVPVPEKAEGGGARIVYYDEAPKTKNLQQIKDMTDGCLLGEDGFSKEGVSILTGVAGDFGKFGKDYIDMWGKYKHNFVRWFIPAWVGMLVDDYGNEDIEQAVMMILQERYQVAQSKSENALLNILQKHPLSPDEALQTPSNSFINTAKVMMQYKRVIDEPQNYIREGDFEWNADKTNCYWKDSDTNDKVEPKISLIELPPIVKQQKISTDYVMYVDCYDIKDKMDEGSKGAAYVYKMPQDISDAKLERYIDMFQLANNNEERIAALLKMGGLPVLEYIDMPDIEEFNERIAKIFTAYNCMAMVEKLPSQTFNTLYNKYKVYLQYKPLKVGEEKGFKKAKLKERGIKVDEYWKSERNRCIKWYVDNHVDRIYFPKLLTDMMTYDPDIDRKKFDSVDAFGGVIIHSQQDLLLKVLGDQVEADYTSDIFFGIQINNGILTRV